MDYAVVAFVDVLGFAEMVQTDSKAPKPKFLNTFLKVLDDIRANHGDAVRMFSDSIVIEAGLELNGVQRVLSVARDLQIEFLGQGVLVRGGVAFGKHYSDVNAIYSEALVNAYYIESRRARNPRIVVDPNLIDYFKHHPGASAEQVDWIAGALCRDRDGCSFIHYIDSESLEELTPKVASVLASTDRRSDSVVEKICWLLDYHSFVCSSVGREDLKLHDARLSFSAC